MVRVGVGVDDVADVIRLDPVLAHLFQELWNVAGQPRVDEGPDLATDVEAVAVVVEIVGPFVHIYVFGKSHHSSSISFSSTQALRCVAVTQVFFEPDGQTVSHRSLSTHIPNIHGGAAGGLKRSRNSLQRPPFVGCSKRVECKAPEIPCREAYQTVRRAERDEGNTADALFQQPSVFTACPPKSRP